MEVALYLVSRATAGRRQNGQDKNEQCPSRILRQACRSSMGMRCVSGSMSLFKPEGRMGKHAHRSGKHAMWWNAGGVSMPTDPASMPCGGMLAG